MHVAGSIVSGSSPITLDLELVAGKGGRGQISENGLSFNLIQVDGTAYISGSPAFYSHFGGPAAAQLLEGKWLKAPASSGSFSTLGSLTNLNQLLSTLLAEPGTLAKGPPARSTDSRCYRHRRLARRHPVRRHDGQALPDRDHQERQDRRQDLLHGLERARHAGGAEGRDRPGAAEANH